MKQLKMDARDKAELAGMALRHFAANLNQWSLLAMGLFAPYEDLSDEEYEELRRSARVGLLALAAEFEREEARPIHATK